jgi:N-acetylglucosaminyl-diphospho-decaprenol L-rhamnosyltransferase
MRHGNRADRTPSGVEVESVNESSATRNPFQQRPRLTVIIVNFESWPDVIRLTTSLISEPEFASAQCPVIVVDNASAGPVPDRFMACPDGLRLIARTDNGGFAAGVNAGWRAAQSPWLLILNPDVEIAQGFLGQVFAQLLRYEADPNGPPGIVGFGLRNPDGSPQGSVGVFPNLARTIWEQFIPRSRRKYQAGWRIRSGPVEWVTGACMLVNAATMNALQGMDEEFFLYYEEVAFSRAAQRLGWRVEYDANVHVIHRHPLQNRALSPRMRVITRHSKLLYFRKHLPRWQFLTLCQIVLVEARARGLRSRLEGRQEEVRAWGVIEDVARRLRSGAELRGRDVLKLADSVSLSERTERDPDQAATGPDPDSTDHSTTAVASARMQRGARRATFLHPRKDGPA